MRAARDCPWAKGLSSWLWKRSSMPRAQDVRPSRSSRASAAARMDLISSLPSQPAMERAAVDAKAVQRYHAHGTATVQNDRMEAIAHGTLFSGSSVPVCAVKGSIGHTLGAAGALDVAICALTLQRQVLPQVTNLRRVDPLASVPAVMGVARSDRGRLALAVSAGFGGINAALLLRDPRAIQ